MIEIKQDNGVITMRSKPNLSALTPWGPVERLFPPISEPDTAAVSPDVSPVVAPLREWPNFAKVKRTLTNFYTGKMKCTVTHIPDRVRDGVCTHNACTHEGYMHAHIKGTHT